SAFVVAFSHRSGTPAGGRGAEPGALGRGIRFFRGTDPAFALPARDRGHGLARPSSLFIEEAGFSGAGERSPGRGYLASGAARVGLQALERSAVPRRPYLLA